MTMRRNCLDRISGVMRLERGTATRITPVSKDMGTGAVIAFSLLCSIWEEWNKPLMDQMWTHFLGNEEACMYSVKKFQLPKEFALYRMAVLEEEWMNTAFNILASALQIGNRTCCPHQILIPYQRTSLLVVLKNWLTIRVFGWIREFETLVLCWL